MLRVVEISCWLIPSQSVIVFYIICDGQFDRYTDEGLSRSLTLEDTIKESVTSTFIDNF